MKSILTLSLLFIATLTTLAQTDGLSYQAIIIDPNPQELPGVDGTSNVLINADVAFRFSVLDENGITEYQEVQNTTTDAFGMVNLTIGEGTPEVGLFTEIFWDGKKKDLKVDISIEGNFNELSYQRLLFVPYALHRDIIATGFLDVTGNTTLNSTLTVEGTTELNSSLTVNNNKATALTGSLTVDGFTKLNNTLTVANESPTDLTGTLTVLGKTLLGDSLTVQGDTYLRRDLQVDRITNLFDSLTVNNESFTKLTGSLQVDGVTDFEGDVSIRDGGDLNVSGDLTIEGATTFDGDLTVNGNTNLNQELNVNNASPTNLTGTLVVDGETQFQDNLQVLGTTNLENSLDVNNQSPTNLSGTLTVQEETNLNNGLNVNNGSPTVLSGSLNVDGLIGFGNDVTIEGVTNLNNTLNVNNGASTNLSGTLTVTQATQLNNTLTVAEATTLQNTLDVLNASATNLTGTLTIDGATTLQNTLDVLNGSASSLSGTLTVDGETTLNNNLTVANNSPTDLSGTLNVDGETTLGDDLEVINESTTLLTGTLSVDQGGFFNNALEVLNGSATTLTGTLGVTQATILNNSLTVANASPTNLSGALTVDGITNLNNALTIAGATLIDNDLTVTGVTALGAINTSSISVLADVPGFVATFQNNNNGNGDGIVIKLGKTHGAFAGTMVPVGAQVDAQGFLNIPQTIPALFQSGINTTKGILGNTNPTSLSPQDLLNLVPANFIAGAFIGVGNGVFNLINDQLNLPVQFPAITIPSTQLLPRTVITNDVTVPVIGLTIPGVTIPEVRLPQINVSPSFTLLPAIPNINIAGLPTVTIPTTNIDNVDNTLSKENEYVTFQDKDGRWTGAIRAQSVGDFKDNTIFDDIYVLNVLSGFVGVDLLDGLATGGTEIANLVDAYNKIGVEYASGNGDYAEWLERKNFQEYITSGDIVAIKGGKITKDLTNAEQIMVVSHRPIILGNSPEKDRAHFGNTIAFMGQVPVKVLGPVHTGDFIVASTKISGYGIAMHPKNMTPQDFKKAVGRSWNENLSEGPKMVNTVVGVHNGDWAGIITKIKEKQEAYEEKYKTLEAQVEMLDKKADQVLFNEKN